MGIGEVMGHVTWARFSCAAGLALAALAAVGCSPEPARERIGSLEQPLSPIATRTFGFESLSDWSPLQSNPVLSLSPLHTEGAFSLELNGGGWMQVESRKLARESDAPSLVGYDIRIPAAPLNRWWHGTTALFLDAPSVGIFNQFVGQVELTGFPLGQFKRVELPIPATLKTKLNGDYQDLRLRVVVNASPHEPAGYQLDRFTFGPAESTCTPVSDGNPCTDDVCVNGSPQSVPRTTGIPCDDNATVCDGSGTCSATAVCEIGPAPPIDDGNACTTDACDPISGVQHLPVASGVVCENDGNVCNGIAHCDGSGACQTGSAPSLDDGNPCTADACDPISGVSHVVLAQGTSCDADANVCNGAAQCDALGVCQVQLAPTVDDGNPCTADACDPVSGVSHTPLANATSCNDGNACTVADSCQNGACVTGSIKACTALDQCHEAGVCDPLSGACSAPEKPSGTACDDGNACTLADTCQSGSCVAATTKTCAPLDQCHDAGVCSPQTGACSNPAKPNGASCSDGNACTQSDSCVSGACSGGSPVACTAPDACHMAGTCDTSTGVCSSAPKPDGAACDDGTVCNGREICTTGTCTASTAPVIDDGNPCTADACDAATGVAHTPLAAGTSCADANACNGAELCNGAGQCSPGSGPPLDDQNPCTIDSCDAVQGVMHTPAAAGTACDDQSSCNGHETCNGAGACAGGAAPPLSDENPCTTDSCDPVLGIQHTPLPAGTSCTDADACNGVEECSAAGVCMQGPPIAIDDGNACTEDDCDPASGPTHTPIPNCGAGITPGVPFETRASVLGRLVRADGAAVTSFTLSVFEDTLDSPERDDVLVEVSSGGAFRARLSDFPESVLERTPPTKLLVRIEGPDFATIVRIAYVRPGDAADLGKVIVLDRDPQVTVIGPAGGTATDSRNLYVLEVPPGALSSPTPITITPILARNQFPTPLPNTTLTTYGVELEPSGTEFAAPARLRIKNTLNLPTSLRIPFGTVDPDTAEWDHTGFAVWDGTRFSAQVTHFSPKDCNAGAIGELVAVVEDGADPHRSGDTKCVGSSVGISNGALKQSFDLPRYGASGNDYGVSFNYDSSLSGSVSIGRSAGGVVQPGGGPAPLVISLAPPKVHFQCLPAGGGGGAGAGCGGGGPCTFGGVVLPTQVNRTLSLLGRDITSDESLPSGAQDTDVVSLALPNGEDGSPMRSGYIKASVSRTVRAGGGTCAATGMGFGVAAPAPAPTGGFQQGSAVRTNQEPGPQVEFPSYELAVHRRGSPYGSGWSVGQHRNLYRTPDRLSADIIHGGGERETFRPYPLPQSLGVPGDSWNGAAAVDSTTGELFVARSAGQAGISKVNPDTGATTLVAGASFGSWAPRDLKISYLNGQRHFLVATPVAIFDIPASGPARTIFNFTTNRPAAVAGIGRFVYFTDGTLPLASGVDGRVIHRIDLTDPTLSVLDLTPAETGDLRFDPRGTATAKDFLFLHARGLAAAPDGGLYVADDRRHAVYKLMPDALGEVGPNSPVTRVLGSGEDSSAGGIGRSFPALSLAVRAPAFLSTAPDGSLYVVSSDDTLGTLVVYDPVEQTARYTATDSNAQNKSVNVSFQLGSLGALSGSQFFVVVPSGTPVVVSTPLSSQFDPTRTITFSENGAEVVDTSADVIETYEWLNAAKTEARMVAQRWRSGEPIFSVAYKDADRIDYVQDAAGGRTVFDYDGRGKLTSVRDAAGRTTSVVIDDDGNLREVTFPNGEARRYDYEAYRMVSATQPNGESSSYTYAADGTLQSATKPGGATTQLHSALSQGAKYGGNGRTYYEASLTDARGVTHTYEINPEGVTVKDTYTADGANYSVENVLASELAGGSFYANTGNRLQRVSHTLVNGTLVGPVTSFDTHGRAFGVVKDLSGGVGRFFTDTYNLNGRVTARNFAGTDVDWNYRYDPAGHLIERFDQAPQLPPSGRRLLVGGFRSVDGQPTSVTQHGVTTTLGYNDRGQLTSTIDTLGLTSDVHYDAAGNPILTDDGTTTVAYAYDNGNRVTSVTDAEGNATLLGYESAGCACSQANQLTSLITPDLEPGQKWSFAYDADSRPTLTTNPLGETELLTWTPQGDLTRIRDRKGRPTTFTHDQLGRVTTISDPANRIGVYAYSQPTAGGWSGPTLYVQSANSSPGPTSLTAALADGQYQVGVNGLRVGANPDRVELYRDATFRLALWLRHDDANRLVFRNDRTTVPFESTQPGPSQIPFLEENRTYDTFGSPFSLLKTIETYDKYQSNRYTYASVDRNADFDITNLSNMLGSTTSEDQSLPRDAGGRLTGSQTHVTSPLAHPPASSIGYKPNGQIETISGLAGRQTFTYDARGLVSQRSLTTTRANGTTVDVGNFGYHYDKLGRNTRLDYPEGHNRQQVFDALGRLTSRCYAYADGSPQRCYTASYDATGNPKTLTDPEMRLEISYDALDRVTEVQRFVPPGSTTPAHIETYAYNALGSFSIYDSQVVDDKRPRLDGSGTASAGIPATMGGAAIPLDGAGRVSDLDGNKLKYFGIQHLLQAMVQGNIERRFGYDALSRNVGEATWQVNSEFSEARQSSRAYLYDGAENNIAAFYVTSFDTPTQREVSKGIQQGVIYDGLDRPLWQIDKSLNLTYYFELDTLGNVRRLHAGQDLLTTPDPTYRGDLGGYAYTAFGKSLGPSDPGGSAEPTVRGVAPFQPFRWQARLLIAPGLYDFRARVFSTELGAFLQPDEYGFISRGGTLWSWPGQNPFRWRDPSGRIGFDGQSTDRAIGAGQDWGDPAFQRGMNQGFAAGALLGALGVEAAGGGISLGISGFLTRLSASPAALLRWLGLAGAASTQLVKGCADAEVGISGSPARGAGWAEGRAAQLAEMIPKAQQGRITMGAGLARDAEGNLIRLIGTSEPNGYLRPGVSLLEGEVLAPGLGHAEADIAAFAQSRGWTLIETAATRPICPGCMNATYGAGGIPLGPLKLGP